MKRLLKCPFCGHAFRVSENRLGRGLTCPSCNEEFKSILADAAAESSSQRGAGGKAPVGRKFLGISIGDPSVVLEGSVPGAIGGLMAGMLGTLVIGIITGENLGVVAANVMLGFVGGFGVGTLGGMLLMALGRRFRADFRIKAGFLSFLLGAAIGAVVTWLLEERKWIPLGAGIGAVGATLWPMLFRRLEAKLNPPTPVTFDQDPFPEEREKSRRYSI
jgi:hypothetical protein